jgi:hypothetical protein
MPTEVRIAADRCALVLHVHGYERPDEVTGADANWLAAEAELRVSSKGVFEARQAISLRTEELARFRDQLAEMLHTLSGEATLTHMEEEVGCTIRLEAGVGELEADLCEPSGIELRAAEIRTDQSYLQPTLRQLDALVGAFPIRGDPIR